MLLLRASRVCCVCCGLLAAASGCGGESTDRYVPESTRARQALEAALTAWQAGKPHETIRTSDTPIDVYDARWRDGQKLESFEIVEELPGNPHPTFKVRLRFAKANQDEEDTFRIVGIDPLLVFREEDYSRATGM